MKKLLYFANASSSHVVKFVEYFHDSYDTAVVFIGDAPRSYPENVRLYKLYDFTSTRADYILNLGRVRNIIREFSPELIHAHYASSYGLLASFFKSRAPVIVSAWGTDITEFPRRSALNEFLLKRTLSRSDLILATSKHLLKETAKYSPAGAEMLHTPFGVDTGIFGAPDIEKSLNRHDAGTIKLFLAKDFEKYYNHEFIFELISRFKKTFAAPRIEITLAGKGSLEEYLKEKAAHLGIAESVKFIGRIGRERVAGELRGTDIVLMPSFVESYGVFALEAQAAGVPVIASASGGLGEVVLDQKTGFVIPLEDKEAYFERLRLLVFDRELRERMGRCAAAFVKKNFELARCMEKIGAIYERVLKRQRL